MKLVADHSNADTPERSDYPTLTASATEGTVNTDPAWYTPARLLIAFCVVSFLVFLDRGIIASNGVNGDKESKTGIQVDSNLQQSHGESASLTSRSSCSSLPHASNDTMHLAAVVLQHDVLYVIYLLTNMLTSCCHKMHMCYKISPDMRTCCMCAAHVYSQLFQRAHCPVL